LLHSHQADFPISGNNFKRYYLSGGYEALYLGLRPASWMIDCATSSVIIQVWKTAFAHFIKILKCENSNTLIVTQIPSL